MTLSLPLVLLLQQGAFLGATTPASGDTAGYWQQRVHYTIQAVLDEPRQMLRARGDVWYVNNSPDTLREMYVHQYLNAFRPQSKWSQLDARENRERFQNLVEPNYGYERFSTPPTVNGQAVFIEYPGAPDSTVARWRLPRPLAPGDSALVHFEWEARPSTVPRRQGRRDRTWDFAQWYPKFAVYDRGGWQPNPLIPAGEFYGEFGTYDVTLQVADDQVIGSTGVPVAGDPGWARVSRTGTPYLGAGAYGAVPAALPTVAAGQRTVRFRAENVHHFGWSASPDYRYEGAVYVRAARQTARFRTWDTVGVHVLFKPGDESSWGNRIAVDRTIDALRWLEELYGPYAYPQITNLHRLDGGGTEFPMLLMDGSASAGLILHELGHVYTYGILANNEWRSGWLDEGLTSYQTDWAQSLTPQEAMRRRAAVAPPRLAPGYHANAATIPASASAGLPQLRLELAGRAEPIGTHSAEFREFGIYNQMIYTRAAAMYAHLRDVMGDTAFRAFLRDYYDRWALRHVDERAMRASAERAHGASLGWFFDQWVHRTGLLDYGIDGVSTARAADGRYLTRVELSRNGAYRHPMPVGIHTGSGWSIARARVDLDRQILEIATAGAPDSVRLDPFGFTWDWDHRNNIGGAPLSTLRNPKLVFDWPFLDQAHRAHTTVAWRPRAWISEPQGVALGGSLRASYLGQVDRQELGLAFYTDSPSDTAGRRLGAVDRLQIWASAENLYLPWLFDRPLMGYSAGAAFLDGVVKLDAARKWDLSPFHLANGPAVEARAGFTGAYPTERRLLPEQWSNENVNELWLSARARGPRQADSGSVSASLDIGLGAATPRAPGAGIAVDGTRGYLRALASIGQVVALVPQRRTIAVRAFGGVAHNAPTQRAVFASTADPFATFGNEWFRPRGGLFKREGVNVLPVGGAGLRGYAPSLMSDGVIAVNGEFAELIRNWRGPFGQLALSATAFGDVAAMSGQAGPVADAGVGLLVRGRLYDRDVNVRIDLPLFLSDPGAGVGGGAGAGSVALRWSIGVGDLFR